MKTILLGATLTLISLASFAQAKKTTIYCSVNLSVMGNKRVDYGNLEKLLPDSIKSKVLVYPSKDVRLRNWNDLLLWMSLHGWTLATMETDVNGTGFVSSQTSLILGRDIYLDEPSRAFMLDRVEKIEQPVRKAE